MPATHPQLKRELETTYSIPNRKLLLRPNNRTTPLRRIQRALPLNNSLPHTTASTTSPAPNLSNGIPVVRHGDVL